MIATPVPTQRTARRLAARAALASLLILAAASCKLAVDLGPGGEEPPPPPSGALPAANRQLPDWAAYEALGVRNAAAGTSYQDPVTGVRVWKASSATVPSVNSGFGHAYSSGPLQVSWPSNGVYTLRVYGTSNGSNWLVDFTPGTGFSRWRSSPAASDLSSTMSYNQSTPKIMYYLSGSTLRRYDTGTMADAPSGRFPKDLSAHGSGFTWLHQTYDDRYFCVMATAPAIKVVVWDSQTDVTWTLSQSDVSGVGYINEPHLVRSGRYVIVTYNDGWGVWDTETGRFTQKQRGSSHEETLGGLLISVDPDLSTGPQFRYELQPLTSGTSPVPLPGSRFEYATAANVTPQPQHRGGQWFQSGVPVTEQYGIHSNYYLEGNVALGGWTLDAGNVYSAPVSYTYQQASIGVLGVEQLAAGDGTRIARQLTKAASRAAMVESSFYYDVATNRVYAWANGGINPSGQVRARAPARVHDGVGFLRADAGDFRLIAHHYSHIPPSLYDYWDTPRATVSPDGRVVLFDSNMNDADGRNDLFVVEIPAP